MNNMNSKVDILLGSSILEDSLPNLPLPFWVMTTTYPQYTKLRDTLRSTNAYYFEDRIVFQINDFGNDKDLVLDSIEGQELDPILKRPDNFRPDYLEVIDNKWWDIITRELRRAWHRRYGGAPSINDTEEVLQLVSNARVKSPYEELDLIIDRIIKNDLFINYGD